MLVLVSSLGYGGARLRALYVRHDSMGMIICDNPSGYARLRASCARQLMPRSAERRGRVVVPAYRLGAKGNEMVLTNARECGILDRQKHISRGTRRCPTER